MKKEILSISALAVTLSFGASAAGEIFHQNAAIRAVQQHMVAIKPAIEGILSSMKQEYDATGEYPPVDSFEGTFNNLPITVSYGNGSNNEVEVAFTDITGANIPAALDGKKIVLTPESNNYTVERFSCTTDIDTNANFWDGYKSPATTKPSIVAMGLGSFYKDCTVI